MLFVSTYKELIIVVLNIFKLPCLLDMKTKFFEDLSNQECRGLRPSLRTTGYKSLPLESSDFILTGKETSKTFKYMAYQTVVSSIEKTNQGRQTESASVEVRVVQV